MTKWISVKDRLPRDNVSVLIVSDIFLSKIRIGSIKYRSSDYFWEVIDFDYEVLINKEVTHWMPLPEPPKE